MSRLTANRRSIIICVASGVFAATCGCALAQAEEPAPRKAEAIQDNSFLVEEAYNQEAGIVQHILTLEQGVETLRGPDDRAWTLAFTQEWPLFSQRHQLSYTVPYIFQDTGGQSDNGIGDVQLNYRLQALTETDTRPACAPRFSLILPTGDEDEDLGNGTVGYQFNLPVSKVTGDSWTANVNAGLTLLPDVDGRDLVNFNLGASAIYAVTPTFNCMLELVSNWDEETGGARPAAVVVSPGIRYAVNFHSGAQLVVGVAAPIGLTSAADDFGAFLYFSFEHAFLRKQ